MPETRQLVSRLERLSADGRFRTRLLYLVDSIDKFKNCPEFIVNEILSQGVTGFAVRALPVPLTTTVSLLPAEFFIWQREFAAFGASTQYSAASPFFFVEEPLLIESLMRIYDHQWSNVPPEFQFLDNSPKKSNFMSMRKKVMRICQKLAKTNRPLALPEVESGLAGANWRGDINYVSTKFEEGVHSLNSFVDAVDQPSTETDLGNFGVISSLTSDVVGPLVRLLDARLGEQRKFRLVLGISDEEDLQALSTELLPVCRRTHAEVEIVPAPCFKSCIGPVNLDILVQPGLSCVMLRSKFNPPLSFLFSSRTVERTLNRAASSVWDPNISCLYSTERETNLVDKIRKTLARWRVLPDELK
jgi:hypothetical protein